MKPKNKTFINFTNDGGNGDSNVPPKRLCSRVVRKSALRLSSSVISSVFLNARDGCNNHRCYHIATAVGVKRTVFFFYFLLLLLFQAVVFGRSQRLRTDDETYCDRETNALLKKSKYISPRRTADRMTDDRECNNNIRIRSIRKTVEGQSDCITLLIKNVFSFHLNSYATCVYTCHRNTRSAL